MNSVLKKYDKIQIPDYVPYYLDGQQYGYDKVGKQQANLKRALLEISEAYCMYCYRKVVIDNIDYSQIEHAIEKGNSKKLRNCKYNLGLSCSYCNCSAKRKNESKRVQYIKSRKEYEDYLQGKCTSPQCSGICNEYRNLVHAYQDGPFGGICLKPGITWFRDTGHRALIQYDILKGVYEPSYLVDYSTKERQFINGHIRQFNLNDPELRTDEFYRYCKDVIDGRVNCRAEKIYNNLLVDLFIRNVNDLPDSGVHKICEISYLMAKAKGRL